MEEEKYNKIVEEFLSVSARTTLVAHDMKNGDSVGVQHLSADDLKITEEVKARLLKALPEIDSKQLIELLSQTKDFEVIAEIEKELVKR